MGKQTIQEIAKILVEKNKLTTKEANQFVALMFEVIQQGLDDEGMVKIKGFGTFKKIQVEARESVSVRTGARVTIDSHAKITFTPDAMMKELVNKPFSQFETVMLNDGVEFEDLADDLTEEEMAEVDAMDTPVIEDTPQPVAEETPQPVVQPLMEFVDDAPNPEEAPAEEETEEEEEETPEEEYEGGSSWKKIFGYILLTILLMAASAYAGYWYGQKKANAGDEPTDVDVVAADSIEVIEVDSVDITEEPIAEEQPKVIAEQPKVIAEQPKVNEGEPIWKKYEAMDVRVRTGAYHIVGTDREVKVRPGETLSRIARRELGEGMSCYIEVYNGLNAKSELKEGQVIKIPKLKWKKKRSTD